VLAARASNNLASLLVGPESIDEARDLIDSAIVELGPNPTLLDTRALIWLAAGDTTRAIEDRRRRGEIDDETARLPRPSRSRTSA
jgi:alkanesulfonate monooxygenase SsuD/methylene tetrahydromethanopterin reductase-like flavin-dependent oxidoreductase (luciferase family)